MHYFDIGMKVVHEWRVVWSTVKQQKNIEWDVHLQAIFLYLWDKVVENQSWKMACVTQALGLLFHTTRGEPLAMLLRALGFCE